MHIFKPEFDSDIVTEEIWKKRKKLVVFSFFNSFIWFSIVFTLFENNKFIWKFTVITSFFNQYKILIELEEGFYQMDLKFS